MIKTYVSYVVNEQIHKVKAFKMVTGVYTPFVMESIESQCTPDNQLFSSRYRHSLSSHITHVPHHSPGHCIVYQAMHILVNILLPNFHRGQNRTDG